MTSYLKGLHAGRSSNSLKFSTGANQWKYLFFRCRGFSKLKHLEESFFLILQVLYIMCNIYIYMYNSVIQQQVFTSH